MQKACAKRGWGGGTAPQVVSGGGMRIHNQRRLCSDKLNHTEARENAFSLFTVFSNRHIYSALSSVFFQMLMNNDDASAISFAYEPRVNRDGHTFLVSRSMLWALPLSRYFRNVGAWECKYYTGIVGHR